jgi:hypothetical protein
MSNLSNGHRTDRRASEMPGSSCSGAVHQPCMPMQLHDASPPPTKPPPAALSGNHGQVGRRVGGEQPPESSHPRPGCGFQIKTPFPGYVLRTTRGYRLQRLRRTQLPAPKGRGDTGWGDPGFPSAPPRAVAVRRVAARVAVGCLSGKGAPKGTTTDFKGRSLRSYQPFVGVG